MPIDRKRKFLMKCSPFYLLLALVAWASSSPTVALAGKSARRAAENCKAEDCATGSSDGNWLAGLVFFAVCVLAALWAEWDDKKKREKYISELEEHRLNLLQQQNEKFD